MELEFIRWLTERLPKHPRLALGVGDDAAIVTHRGTQTVITVDMLTDGVDFELDKVDASLAGRKALAVNLSDLAAMAVQPLAAVVALALPKAGALELAKRLYEGLIPLAGQFDVALAGGDTNTWDGPLVISVTLTGEVLPGGPLLRSGAQPGDAIVVTGAFGGSILGHHFDFTPRVNESLWLANHHPAHAGIDVSDGLSLDLWRVCQASACGAVLESLRIPLAPAAHELAKQDGTSALDHALGDGEDFELVLAMAPEVAQQLVAEQPLDCPISIIGQFVAERGLWLADERGARRRLVPRGFEH